MQSAGLELTKLTYTRLEDNLIRHRGNRHLYVCMSCAAAAVVYLVCWYVVCFYLLPLLLLLWW